MVNYGLAATVLLALSAASVDGFSFRSLATLRSRGTCRELAGTTYYSEDDDKSLRNLREDVNRLGADVNKLGSEAMENLSRVVVDDEVDVYEAEIARKERIVLESGREYLVDLSLTAPLGVTLCQVDRGQEFSELDLDLDSLNFRAPLAPSSGKQEGEPVTINLSEAKKRLPESFRGVVVSSVVKGGQAWREGVRPGDTLLSTSATVGDALWPKSTLEGVRSAIASRKVASGNVAFRFERSTEEVASQYELTLSKPLGIEVRETEDGYVEVTGLNSNAPKLARYAINVGDRILAIDASFGGRMWPVSTVEGVISACTSRLPGQPIRMRFARPHVNEEEATGIKTIAPLSSTMESDVVVAKDTKSDEQLLVRCREVLKRYTSEEQQTDRVKFADKYAVPALVADKVLDAVASASLSFDCVTLSMVMNAYLACRKPDAAIRAFEGAVGLKADGSAAPALEVIQGKKRGALVPNASALNLISASSLMRAHAMKGDSAAVQLVLAAMEGRAGVNVAGIESAEWPNTGIYGSIRPDTQCYNIALSVAAKAGDANGIDAAVALFESMSEPREAGSKPAKDLISYNTIIGALSKVGRSDEAFSIFDRMKRSYVKPDKFTYTSLIKACVHDGDIQELLFDMKEQGVQPDVVTYNTIIKSLCDRFQWYEAKKLVTEMEARGIAPNSMTYGLLMSGLLKANKPSTCLTLFETACADGRTASLTENVHLYTTAIAASSAIGNHERALDLVSRMNIAGVKPNLKTMTALMSAFLSSGKTDLAIDVYRRMDNPDGYAMLIGLKAMCSQGDFVSAFKLISEQRSGRKNRSGKQVMESFNFLLRTTLKEGDHSMARQTFAELLNSGYIPSKTAFQIMLEALEMAPRARSQLSKEIPPENFDFALYVLDALCARNLQCDGSFYSCILHTGARLGGLRRKLASLLAESRAVTVESNIQRAGEIVKQEEANGKIVVKWADLIENYNDYKHRLGTVELPPLAVRIGPKEVRHVLSAEQRVTYEKRVPRRQLV